jgi:hypothetical protein
MHTYLNCAAYPGPFCSIPKGSRRADNCHHFEYVFSTYQASICVHIVVCKARERPACGIEIDSTEQKVQQTGLIVHTRATIVARIWRRRCNPSRKAPSFPCPRRKNQRRIEDKLQRSESSMAPVESKTRARREGSFPLHAGGERIRK